MIRHLDLFSGIGGFALAVRWLGGQTVGFCEIEEYPQRLLAKNFPGVPIHADIRTLKGDGYGPVDLVTGGFPCQPFSIAGQRRGAEDDRALWPEMARVIAEARPRWVLGENVTGIVSMELDTVLADLEALGYTAWPLVVPAVAVDAPHRRDRVWIMAHRDDGLCHNANEAIRAGRDAALCSGESLANTEGIARCGFTSGQTGQPALGGQNVSDADRAGQQEQRVCFPANPEYAAVERGCRWPAEPGVGRVAHGVPGRVDRLRGLGNAIVPQVAYEILRVMLADVLPL